MQKRSVVQIVAVDIILVGLLALVENDIASRTHYFLSEGFSPSTSLFPLTTITAAVRGSTFIPGLLTVDWAQVLVLLLLFFNGSFLLGQLRLRRARSRVVPPVGP